MTSVGQRASRLASYGAHKAKTMAGNLAKDVKGVRGMKPEQYSASQKRLSELHSLRNLGGKGGKSMLGAKAGMHLARHAGKYGLGAAAAAGAAGAMHKRSSAVDRLAEIRAEEMLKEAGVTSAPAVQLHDVVEARAVEMLKAAGYTFGN